MYISRRLPCINIHCTSLFLNLVILILFCFVIRNVSEHRCTSDSKCLRCHRRGRTRCFARNRPDGYFEFSSWLRPFVPRRGGEWFSARVHAQSGGPSRERSRPSIREIGRTSDRINEPEPDRVDVPFARSSNLNLNLKGNDRGNVQTSQTMIRVSRVYYCDVCAAAVVDWFLPRLIKRWLRALVLWRLVFAIGQRFLSPLSRSWQSRRRVFAKLQEDARVDSKTSVPSDLSLWWK